MAKLLMIVVIVIGGAVIMYRWPGAPALVFNRTRGIAKIEPVPQAAEKPPEKPAERKGSRFKTVPAAGAAPSRRAPDETPLLVPLPVQTTSAQIASSQPNLPFPTPETLKKGSTAAELRSHFGSPAFDVASSSEGRVLERFYYLNRERDRLTVTTLENGILISAYSVSSPYFQLPSAKDSGLLNPPR